MEVYLEESGDLGFTFDKQFRKGGSSRYLTLSFLLTPKKLSHLPKRIVRNLYDKKKHSTRIALKGTELTLPERVNFAGQAAGLLSQYPEIKVFSVTLDKRTIKRPLLRDGSRLFCQVCRLILLDRIKREPNVILIPDKRSVKVKNGTLLADYLQTEIWFEYDSDTIIENSPLEKQNSLNLQFLDWVGHIIWKKYEDHEIKAYDILKKRVDLTPWWETLSSHW